MTPNSSFAAADRQTATRVRSGYHKATKIKLWYNANNPKTLTKSLHRLAQYAKTLSNNIAFNLSKAQLEKISGGQSFSSAISHAKIKFTVDTGRIRVYTLVITKNKR